MAGLTINDNSRVKEYRKYSLTAWRPPEKGARRFLHFIFVYGGFNKILPRSNKPGRKTGFSLIGVEVKGVTLEDSGRVMFPDAPTARGTKHVYEMIDAVKKGYFGYIFFLIQMRGVNYFTPNREMDVEFTKALKLAKKEGVKILAYDSIVRPDEIILGEQVEIRL